MIASAVGSVHRFTVNGLPVEVTGPGGRRLLDVLRVDLELTGTKEGCGEGECGACTVLVDGEVVDSCLVPVSQVAGHDVRTVEGLARGARPDPLQAAFLETGGAQCGICTPGMLLAGRAFLDSGAPPTDAAIREAIAGNLCRCTGYTKIVEAIALAADGGPREDGDGAAIAWSGPHRVAPTAPALPDARPEAGTMARGGPPVLGPSSLGDALVMLAAEPRPRPIAGGTDLMVALAAGATSPDEPLLDLGALGGLREIRLDGGALSIGATATFARLRRSSLVREHAPLLAAMAATVGAAQIQNRATIGGNIANASPAGDSLPVLLASDAQIVVASARAGERVVPAADFFTAYRRTALAPDELIVRVRLPLAPDRRGRFRKIGTRRAQAISKVVMAVTWREEAGAWRDVRVALGSVAEVPIRARRTEAVLEGARPDAETADAAAAALAGEVRPIDDVRSTATYRRAVAARSLHRIVRDAGGW